MALNIGTKLIGKYTITKLIGEGGFGVVYLAKEGLSGEEVAIKEYFPSQFCRRLNTGKIALKNKDEFHQTMFYKGLDRFGIEAKSLHKIHHDNIIKVTEYFEENNTAYMVMAYIKGMSLEDFLKRQGTLTREQADRILMPIIDALSYIHNYEEGIIHRDIKPGNILIDLNEGKPILIDFGTTMGVGDSGATAFASKFYSAIEQSAETLSDMQGYHTDIYALAATFYHCLTGEKPLDASHRMLNADVVNLVDDLKGQYDERLLKLVDLGLIIRPEQRPQSVDELLKLSGYAPIRESEDPKTPDTPPTDVRPDGDGKAAGESGDKDSKPRKPVIKDESKPVGLIAFLFLLLLGGGGYGAYYFMESGKVSKLDVNFNITPNNAEWKINGRPIVTDSKYSIYPSRTYKMEISAADHKTVAFNLRLRPDGTLNVPSNLRRDAQNAQVLNKNQFNVELKKQTFSVYFTSNAPDVEYSIPGVGSYQPGIELAAGTYMVSATSRSLNNVVTKEVVLGSANQGVSQFDFPFASNLVDVIVRIRPRSISGSATIEFLNEANQPTPPFKLERRRYTARVSAPGYVTKTFPINPAIQSDVTVNMEAEQPQEVVASEPAIPAQVKDLVDSMVNMQAATYQLGCNKQSNSCDKDERSRQGIRLANYKISAAEINNGLWKLCYQQKGCSSVASSNGDRDLPVTNVSYKDTQQFVSWLSNVSQQAYRLPSEAEWEAAAMSFERAVKSDLCRYTNFADSSSPYPWKSSQCNDGTPQGPTKVTSMNKANGLFHILGNVWEMTTTCWQAAASTDIQASCDKPTVKGGAFNNVPARIKASYRSFVDQNAKESNLGFRVVSKS